MQVLLRMIAPKSPIYKHVIELVVLSERQLPDPSELHQIADDIHHGPDIGDWKTIKVEKLTKRKDIQKELRAIGNDGSFFDDIFR